MSTKKNSKTDLLVLCKVQCGMNRTSFSSFAIVCIVCPPLSRFLEGALYKYPE